MTDAKKNTNIAPESDTTKDISKAEQSMSVRFTDKVLKEFSSGVGDIALTEFQKRLIQNYFISLDLSLRVAEEKRLKKSEQYRDKLPITWANVNLEELARNVVAYARVGLDPAQKNHINMMPFKNNNSNKYDIVFIEGYRGIELKATKYGLDVPAAVIVQLVYTNDKFKAIKKSLRNPVESYDFDTVDDFNRGEIKGGFYYHVYNDPTKNKLVVMTLADILKRKPAYASVEFWGGDKEEWKDGKKTGKKEHVDGWYSEMCQKTIHRAAYNDITIDSQKIDTDYLRLKQLEAAASDLRVTAEIEEHANSETLEITEPVIDGEFTAEELGDAPSPTSPATPTATKGKDASATAPQKGPNF